MSLASEVAKDRGQPATVRVGVVSSVAPFQVRLQSTELKNVGILSSYLPQLGETVILLGQSAVSADGSSWLAVGAVGSRLGRLAQQVRRTSVTSNGPENGVVRIDNIPVLAGRAYRIYTTTLNLQVSTTGLTAEARIRVETGGTIATNASAALGLARIEGTATAVPGDSTLLATEYYATINTRLSVLMTWQLAGGVGTVTLIGASVSPVGLFVDDVGPDLGNTGVTL